MKRNYWPLFFIGIFSFVFAMIVWTIVRTSEASLDADNSFLKKYQEVDDIYNEMMEANAKFNSKYNLKFFINSKEFALSTEDIRYSQRVLEKKSKHKNLLKIGQNEFKLYVEDKKTLVKQDLGISLLITKSSANDEDIVLTNDEFKEENKVYTNTSSIDKENNWNITGKFSVNGDIGYIFIKTNAI